MTRQEPACGWPPMWQIREVLETLSLRGDLVVPKTVDRDARKVRSLLVAMWLGGLVTWAEESNDFWVFRITRDGWAALSETTRDSEIVRLAECVRVTESAQAFHGDQPQ